ncbi:hypothetical protein RIF29_29343 [Crotalaria pallida]|uniref:Uncharacterized protein n=1 Tax=Crotalaria pallida TaxID=3830 RepID=A0AAN9EJM7_CROPI
MSRPHRTARVVKTFTTVSSGRGPSGRSRQGWGGLSREKGHDGVGCDSLVKLLTTQVVRRVSSLPKRSRDGMGGTRGAEGGPEGLVKAGPKPSLSPPSRPSFSLSLYNISSPTPVNLQPLSYYREQPHHLLVLLLCLIEPFHRRRQLITAATLLTSHLHLLYTFFSPIFFVLCRRPTSSVFFFSPIWPPSHKTLRQRRAPVLLPPSGSRVLPLFSQISVFSSSPPFPARLSDQNHKPLGPGFINGIKEPYAISFDFLGSEVIVLLTLCSVVVNLRRKERG